MATASLLATTELGRIDSDFRGCLNGRVGSFGTPPKSLARVPLRQLNLSHLIFGFWSGIGFMRRVEMEGF
jgi:hypothetical protein